MKKVSLAVIAALTLNSFVVAGPKERAAFALWRFGAGRNLARPALLEGVVARATAATVMPALTVVSTRTMATKDDKRHPVLRWGMEHGWINPTARLQQLTLFGSAQQLKISLEAGANPNFIPHQPGKSPLQWAARTGELEKARMLLKAGADVDLCNTEKETALTLAAKQEDYLEFVKLLLEHKANPNQLTSKGEPLLHQAAREGKLELARTLFIYGANVDTKNEKGLTASFLAWKHGHRDLLNFLLLRTASKPDATDAKDRTILHLAARTGDLRTVEDILAAGANVNATCSRGRFAVHYAVPRLEDSPGTVRIKELIYEMLLEAGSPRNPKDKNGVTPFKIAMNNPVSSRARIRILEMDGIAGPGIRGQIIRAGRAASTGTDIE